MPGKQTDVRPGFGSGVWLGGGKIYENDNSKIETRQGDEAE